MQARFIAKTHTEALRPGNYSILIAKCTYPDQGAYPEQVEKRLTEIISSKSVAKFTVLTATSKNRGFGFLRDNMIWSWKGYVIYTALKFLNKVSIEDPNVFFDLSRLEQVMFLRFFLETEGAMILKLAERAIQTGYIAYSFLKTDIQNIFAEIYNGYLDIAPDFRTRTRLRESQNQLKARNEKYGSGTIAHKVKPHLQALVDLGVLELESIDKDEVYRMLDYNNVRPLEKFHEAIGNFSNLEEIVLKDEYYRVIAEAVNLNPVAYTRPIHEDLLKQSLIYGYVEMRNGVTGMADIESLMTWSRIHLLSEEKILASRSDIERFFGEMRREDPSSIRYHVDGKGNIAYMIISDWL